MTRKISHAKDFCSDSTRQLHSPKPPRSDVGERSGGLSPIDGHRTPALDGDYTNDDEIPMQRLGEVQKSTNSANSV